MRKNEKETVKKMLLLVCVFWALSGSMLEADLIAYWAMDETAGATEAVDSIGIANAIAAASGDNPVAGAAGMFGNAWSFSGSDDNRLHIDPPNQAAFTTLGYSGFSYSGWVNSTDGATDTIFSISDAAAGSEEAALRIVSNQLNFLGRHNTNDNVDITSQQTLNLGQWYHVAVASDLSGTVLYLDGNEVASSPYGVDIATFTTNDNNVSVNFGANNDNGTGLQWEYAGLIDEFRVYDHKLSVSEVESLAVPEPTTMSLIGIGAILLIRKKK
ncbi:hypothetical protein SMSP2_00838 [Limihaloglobus sulfuriphilus]|uniref:Ice-binding protein C-terminal domain-containing protein n=1 Tax=Limihaloglobus sulfuriphilus TaxID=1851148 RepID=A0A1Q2MCQ4_9BACT|nr:LamG-like jellyroll fold domain-containing protein [Limihaloglobus sulfuriphilus]AQQ70486.1 hypothetical protein SMSP2_00838 [Limihaloglobus sulfuriphilus]